MPTKMNMVQRIAYQHLQALNKYDPSELLKQLVQILEKEGLDDEVKEIKALTPKIQKAWRNRDKQQ